MKSILRLPLAGCLRIAPNSKPADLPRLAVIFGRRQLDAFLFLFDIARFQHTGGGLFYLAAFPHHKQR